MAVSIVASLCIVLGLWLTARLLLEGEMSEESEMMHRESHPAEDLDLKDHVLSRLQARIDRFDEGDRCELDLTEDELGLLLNTGHAQLPKDYR